MPGRRRPASVLSSSTIFTGTRCTILVKLPVALSAGNSANSSPLAGDTLSTWPLSTTPGKETDRDLDRLASAYVGELGLLVVGHDENCVERHHRHQPRTGLDVLADAQRAGADHARHGRGDGRIGDIRSFRPGAGPQAALALGLRLGALGGENIELTLGHQKAGAALLKLRGLLAQGGLRLLGTLHGAVTALLQVVVADVVGFGVGQRGLAGGDLGLLLVNGRLLLGDPRVEIADLSVVACDIGLGLGKRDLEVTIVNARDNVARRHRLFVLDQDLGDVAGDPGRDDRVVGTDIGVGGQLQEATDLPVAVPGIDGHGEAGHQGKARAVRFKTFTSDGACTRPPGSSTRRRGRTGRTYNSSR